ncbi:MAG: hypothetical protein JSS82_02970 [Bacteroidetes bacterium]|nr:hypothetical protein [Bacteroidota bacterium]
MPDKIRAVAKIKNPQQVIAGCGTPFRWRGLIFSPSFNKYGEIYRYKSEWRNLLLYLYDSKIVVMNSLHKFYHENNYCDFHYSELCEAVEHVCNKLKIPARDFTLYELEIAVNIATKNPAYTLLDKFIDYKGKPFRKEYAGSKQYGVVCALEEYVLKVYDKSLQTKRVDKVSIPKNILRLEIVYKRRRKIPMYTLEDLIDLKKLSLAFQLFISTWSKVNIESKLLLTQLTSRDRERYYAGLNSQFWVVEKDINYNTAKQKRKAFNCIVNHLPAKNIKRTLIARITDKVYAFLNN